MDVYATFLTAVRSHELIGEADRVLAAVSGGPDSTALLHLLLRYSRDQAFDLAVAHLDHGLRGEASAADAAFAKEMAASAGVPYFGARLGHASGRRLPSEDSLRASRLRFLREQAAAWPATRIALGHTRDDQAETLLLNLLRGSSARGLGGMRPVTDVDPTGGDVPTIRPLLSVPRRDLLEWLRAEGITWREDATNRDSRYLRNRIRHDLLPLLEDLRPGAAATLARAARLVGEDDAYLSDLAAAGARGLAVTDASGRLSLGLGTLGRLPRPLARRILRSVVRQVFRRRERTGHEGAPSVPAWSPGSSQIDAILDRVRTGREGLVDLGRGLVATIDGDRLLICERSRCERPLLGHGGEESGPSPHRHRARPGEPAPRPPVTLPVPGEVTFSPEAGRFQARRVEPAAKGEPEDRDTVRLDEERLAGPLSLRTRRPGDRFRPLGGSGSRRLSDFFIDAKLPRAERDRVPLLLCGEEIAWVVGHRADERFAAGPESRRIVEVRRERPARE